MRIVGISDIHNDVENLLRFLDKVEQLKPDVLIAMGDFLDVNIPKGFREEDIGRLILEELKSLKKPVFVVPGNFDKKLIEMFEEEGISLHGKAARVREVGFYGFGGAITPFNTPLEVTEEEIWNGLTRGYKMIEDCKFKIQVTHIPPFRTKLDLTITGLHVGSKKVREFIEKFKPHVALCSHIHEGRGIDQIGETRIINCGRFPEGYCGLVVIEEGKITTEIVNLNVLE